MNTAPCASCASCAPAAARQARTLALMQCAPLPALPALQADAVATNLARLRHYAHNAQAQGAHLLLLPEMFLSGYAIGPEAVQHLARPAQGEYFQAVAAIAQAHQLAIVYGYPERAEGGAVYNAAQWVSPAGQALLNYRKTHLYGALDRAQFSPAPIDTRASALLDWHGWRCGLLICYDVEFPENARRLALAGADLLLVPTANMNRYDFVPTTLVPTRAFENQTLVAYANYCGHEGPTHYGGLSSIVNALGQPLAHAGRSEELLIAQLEPQALEFARIEQTHLVEVMGRMG